MGVVEAHRRVSVHDVEDVEGYCAAFVERHIRASGARWVEADREDAIQELVLVALRMSGVRDGVYAYEPGNAPTGIFDPTRYRSFAAFLHAQLPLRLVDYLRREKGDARNVTRREFVALDEEAFERQPDPTDYVEQIVDALSAAEDLACVSERSRQILTDVVARLADGASQDAVAEALGVSRRRVDRMLEDVRNELLGRRLGLPMTDGLPPTTDEVVEAIHASAPCADGGQ
jgi:RNA polymerase sigma factor (sigma-70 family)